MHIPKARYLVSSLLEDLHNRKMVFVGGPRQVGKTTLALSILGADSASHRAYLNWDVVQKRASIMKGELPSNEPLIVFDEIHKYLRWRNLLKGFYDQYHSKIRFIVTGSARLDYYRRGGDSLQGRYHYYRLHPFTLGELSYSETQLTHLLHYGGFPEPCIRSSERFLRRWQRERMQRVIYGDLRDLETVREVSLVELLADALPIKVGSPLSIKSLSEDLQVSFMTAERWIQMLERLYVCFRIEPFGAPKIRAVKKERKLYLWDWSLVDDPGARFENLVASHLLKYCHWLEDTEGYKMELRFLRDVDKREINFVVLQNRKPLFAVECKVGAKQLSPAIGYFRARTSIPRFYQVHAESIKNGDYGDAELSVRILPFFRFCEELKIP